MNLYIVRVNENGETYEYEYGCLEHVREHIKMETGECKVYEYENGEEKEIHIEKEEKTMKNTREYRYEIRQLDAWGNAEDGYDINESWHMGEMTTKAENINKAFTAWMKRHLGITFKNNRTLIEYDGDCYTIIDRKTKEPLFIAIPNF